MKSKIFFMAILSVVLFSNIISTAFAAKKQSKIEKRFYTEEEFIKEVKKEMHHYLRRINKEGMANLTKELYQKDQRLISKELNLKKREEKLKLNIESFSLRVKQLEKKQQKIIACLNAQDKKSLKRVQHMVDTIAGMKPNVAAQVLSVQDTDISVQILGRLDPKRVSKIFNLMDKEISARLQKQYMTMKK